MSSFWLSSVGGAFSRRRQAAVARRQRRSRDLQRGEQLEERRVMAFDFVSAFPNVGQFIAPNAKLHEAPQQITLRFSPGAKVDAATLAAITIVRAGGDGDFNNGSVPMTPQNSLGIGLVAVDDFPNQNQVVLRFAETLPDDLYRITIGGGLKTVSGGPGAPAESFRNGGSYSLDFRLDLGAQVVSVVPQPVTRAVGGAIQQARDTIEVYFNANDPLMVGSAQNQRNYRLVETDPSTGEDIAIQIPVTVAYDAVAGKATLTFAAELGDKLYRLQIGGSDDDNGTIAKAVGVGTIFQQVDPATPAYVTNSFLGDGAAGVNDVDLYKLSLTAGATVTVRVTPVAGSGFTPALRLFNPEGAPLPANVSVPNQLTYTAAAAGTFYVGLSSAGNIAYNAVDGTGAAGGTTRGGYRLEISSSAAVGAGDDNSSFDTATGLGTLGLAGQAFNAAISVLPMVPTPAGDLLFPSPPGTIDEPGHREIPLPVETHEMPASSLTGAAPAAVVEYCFPRIYGTDAQGNPLINAITDNQKQRAREIFELYSRATGIRFVETSDSGLKVVTGDLRALDPGIPVPNGPAGLGGPTMAIMNGSLDWEQSEYGGRWHRVAVHEIGHSLGLGHAYDIPAVMGAQTPTVWPGDHDLVHLSVLYPANGTDIDVYSFQLDKRGTLAAETVVARPGQAVTSLLDSVLTLYRQDPATGRRELVARNDDYIGRDSFLGLDLEATNGSGAPYTYFLAVTSAGNTAFNPEVENSGANGRSDGGYRLRMSFTPAGEDSNTIVDATDKPLDGDRDGLAGGAFNFWFRSSTAANTVYVDKLATAAGADGSLAKPFTTVAAGLAATGGGKSIVRIVGNAAATPYLVGTNLINQPLADGTSFAVPSGVTVMIDAGAVFKFRNQVVDVGSSSPIVSRAGAALQVLGTPGSRVQFTSYHDDTIGGNSDGVGPAATGGQWGGIIFRQDSDSATRRVFLNSVSNATVRYGGGQVSIDGSLQTIAPLHLESSRPTIAFNDVRNSAGAAISADPNSFEESNGRAGPAIRGNLVRDNSINGLLVRIRTAFGQPLDKLSVAARFASPDITYVIPENLQIAGGVGGYQTTLQRNGRLVAGSTTVSGLTGVAELAVGMQATGPGLPSSVMQRGNVTAGSPVISGLASVSGLEQGARVAGPGIPDGTTILSINAAARTVTLSGKATLSASGAEFVFNVGRWIASIDPATNSIELTGPATASGSPVTLTFETLIPMARASGRLTIDPGVVVKLQGSRIELERGTSQLYAEGTPQKRVIFTSTKDNRFGAGGTFVVTGGAGNVPLAGDWGGIVVNDAASASIDNASISYGGGQTPVPGGFGPTTTLSVDQGTLRLANSRVENNANGIHVIGAQPVIVANDFRGNGGDLISVDANSLNDRAVADPGRMTGPNGRFTRYDDNRGPLVRGNTVTDGAGTSGMVVRGDQITVESVWDDTDIVHVLRDEIVVSNFHTATGLKLMSSPTASLVVKLRGTAAGLTATGYGLDIDDRIGGTVQVIGQPGYPVILTSLSDDSVGASLDPIGVTVTDTNGDGSASRPTAGEWRGLRFLPYSNDRNVAVFREAEPAATGGVDVNLSPDVSQFIGVLAPNELGGDDNRRLGFEVHGVIALDDPGDVDVYSFSGYAGSEVWIDIDNTSPALDAMVELLDSSGVVLARSADAQTDGSLAAATRGIGQPLLKNPVLGGDFYTRNPRDPGMRVVLPGVTADAPLQYYLRVRSQPKTAANASKAAYEAALRDPAQVADGATSGNYELRVRLRQIDEKPGSTVRYADIRYPVVGVDVQGLPQRSPLTGTTGENTQSNETFANAQYVGNLLGTDMNTISVAGALSGAADIDWYVLDLNYEQIQAIGGVNNGLKTWSTVFDIDYADGFRGDLTLSVFDSSGRLIYVGRDSNVADDQPGAGQTNFEDVSRGSAGKLDPFIGPVHLPTGLPGSGVGEGGVTPPADPNAVPNASTRYYVAVSSNERLPASLDMTFKSAATNTLVRLEPVNSVKRVVEDHIGVVGYHSGEFVIGDDNGSSYTERDYTYVAPTGGPLFSVPNLIDQVPQFTLDDVVTYVAGGGGDAAVGIVAGDIAMRSDGRLYTYTGVPGENTAGTLSWINIRTNAVTPVGNDNIPDYPADSAPTKVTDATADSKAAGLSGTTTPFQLDAHPAATSTVDVSSVTTGTLQYTVTLPGNPLPSTGTWTFVSNATGQLTFTPTFGLPDGMPVPANGLSTVNAAGLVTVTWSAPVLFAGITMTQVAYTYIPNPPDRNMVTTDIVDALAWRRADTVAPTYDRLYYSVRDTEFGTNKQTGYSRLYRADPTTGVANGAVPFGRVGDAAGPTLGLIRDDANRLGVVTGMAFLDGDLYGVDTNGFLFTIDIGAGTAADPGTARATIIANLGFANLQALANGPQNVRAGYFADKLFVLDGTGYLRAFDKHGTQLLNIFQGNTKSEMYLGKTDAKGDIIPGSFTGFAFSPVDVPLWRATNVRGGDAGHGVSLAPDHTRDGLYDDDGNLVPESAGLTSIYYGLDGSNGLANDPARTKLGHLGVVSDRWLGDLIAGVGTSVADLPIKGTGAVTVSGFTAAGSPIVTLASTGRLKVGMPVSGPGIPDWTIVLEIVGQTVILSRDATLTTPADAPVDLLFVGDGIKMTSLPFSLQGYDYTDKPTLYFNYLIGAGSNSTRVEASIDGGSEWITIATNERPRSPLDTSLYPLPAFPSVSSRIGWQPNQLVQELFEGTGWRQARIDLGEFAGASDIRLRLSFNPVTVGGKCEGVYFDDFIVGFAERGEMVTNASAVTSFFDIGTPVSNTTPQQNLQGGYQLEIRRGKEYGVLSSAKNGAVQILGDPYGWEPDNVVDTNAALIRGSAHSGAGYAGVTPGQNLRGDENTPRGQGQFIIEGNVITHADQFGIRIDAAARDAATGASTMGAVKNTPVLNSSRLVPGVVVANNVIASTHREAAILFSGDPSAGLAAPVPYGRIVNNTIHGGVTVNVNGTTIANSSVVTVPRTDGMWAGMVVTGAGIPADTRIASIDSSTQVTLTRPATAAGTGVALTFAFRTAGVQVTDNAAPTLLNNVFASLATGIKVDASSAGTVVGMSAYWNTATPVTGVAESSPVTLATDPFVNAARGNFYPVAKAPIIDTAIDVLQDRPAYVAVTQPLGLPQSPIIAPSRDLFGQLRSDDPGQASPPGLGSNVFKDLGAIDRVDFVQPWLTLAEPLDQGLTDGDPTLNSVSLSGSAATGMAKFILQLNDSGVGIDKTTVVKQAFTIVRDGTTLVEGTDYVFRYLESTNRVVFESPSAFALGEYEIRVTTRPATSSQDGYLTDLANNTLLNNDPDGSTSFTVSLIGLSAPTNLAAAFGDRSVGLTWTAPDAPLDAPVSDYVVQYRTDVIGSSWQTFNDGVGTTAATTVTGLTNGTAYRFRVAAVNTFGTGRYSAEATATPRAVPAAPTGLTGVAGNAQVTLNWTAPVDNGGAAITGYVVEYSTDGGSSWPGSVNAAGTTATVTGLTNGVAYLFRVKAVNSVGTGAASSQAGPYTPAMPASAPTGLTATFGNGSVGLLWTAPSSNGGAAITDYRVEYKTGAGSWTVFNEDTSTNTSATVMPLINGTAYLFRVAAINSVGVGAYSTEVAETPRAAPSMPTGVAGVVGNAQVTLSWNVPAANGATITNYVIEYRTSTAAPTEPWTTLNAATNAATVTGLINGTSYQFRVSAVNSVGTGAASATAGPLTPRTVPNAPTALSGTPQNGQVALTWTAGFDGGAAISGYVVQYRTNEAGSAWTPSTPISVAATPTTATVTGLTNGTAYLFRVSAVNAAGTGAAVESAAVTPRTVPGQVTNVVATGANGRIEVTWNPPASNGGAAISDYLVNYSTSPTGPFVLVNDGVSTATSASITGLTNGVTYYVRVRAVNAAGNSAPAQVGPVVPFVQAAAPTGLAGTVGSGRVNLSWTAGTSPKPITDYVVEFRRDIAGSSWTRVNTGSAATTAAVTGLTNGTRYLFRVAAVNADGIGLFTDGTLGLTPVGLPAAAPTAVTGRGSAGVITLNWVAAPSSVQAPVTGYVIQYRANTSTATWTTLPLTVGNVTTARITTLTSRLGYFFRVAARNAAGQGPWSAASALIRPY